MPESVDRAPSLRRAPRARALVRALVLGCALLGALAAPTAANAITVSGTAFADGGEVTVWAGCDGATNRVALAVNGAFHSAVPCATTGAFTFSGVTPSAADQVLTVWFDGHADKAVHYTRNADTITNIAGLKLIRSQAMLSSQNANPITNADMALWDGPNDADVPVTIGTGNDLTTSLGTLRIHVRAGNTYAPGANVTVPTMRVDGAYAGAGETLVLTGGSASSCTTTSTSGMRPLCLEGAGTFAAPALVRFTRPGPIELANAVTFKALQLHPASGTPTYTLADGASDLVTASTLDVGTGAAAMTALASAGTVRVTGATSVNALATYRATNYADFEHEGDLTGGGTVRADNYAEVEMRPPGGTTVLFGSTSGAATWSLEGLKVQNGGSTDSTVRLAPGGTGPIHVSDTLTVGLSGDLARVTLDAETNDRALDVDTYFDMTSRGTYSASSTAPFTIGKDLDTDTGSQFLANLGTVTFDTAATVTRVTLGGAITFNDVVSTEPAKVLRFDPAYQTNVANLTVNGGACGTRAGLASFVEGTRFNLNVTGTASVQYADISDSNAVAPLTATNSTAGANNLNWTISGSCPTVGISGTAYQDQVGTIWPGCDGITPNIAMSINGYAKRTTTCSASTGEYSFTTVPDPGLLIVVFMDTADPMPGVTYAAAPATATGVSGLDVTYGRIRLRSETANPMTHRLMAMYDVENDASVTVNVTEYSEKMTAASGAEVVIESGDTYRPENDVSIGAMEVHGTYHQSLDRIALDLTRGGTGTDCAAGPGVQMPMCVMPGGTLATDGGMGLVRFTSADPLYVQSTTYPNLIMKPVATNHAITLGHAPGTTMAIDGALQMDNTSGVFATAETSTFSPTIRLLGGVNEGGDLDIEANNTLTGTSDILVTEDIEDAGTVAMTGGTIEHRVSSSESTGPQGAGNHTYNDIVYSNSSTSARTITFHTTAAAGTVTVNGTLRVGRSTDATTTTLVNGSSNETIDVNGSVHVTSKGSLTAASSSSTPFMIGDDFTNQGTFTPSGGRVTFDDAAKISSIVTSAATTFSNLSSTTPNETLRFQNAMTTTVTGTFTANGGSCGSPVALESTTSGSPWTINAGTAAVQYATLSDSTASPARTATSSGNLGGNVGWTFSGGCAAPVSMLSHDTNASGAGIAQNPGILVDTPHVSWVNNSGLAADRQRTQFVNTPVDSTVAALWHLDGTGTDVAGGGGGSIASYAAPNDATWDAAGAQPGFGQVLDVDGDDVATAPAHSSSLDVDTFTVEAWVRLDGLTGAIGSDNVVVEKRASEDAANFRVAIRRTGTSTGVVTADVSTGGAGVVLPAALVGTTNLNDGRWHHLAYVVNSTPADPGKVQAVYVDGVAEATGTFSGNVDNPAVALTLGGSAAIGEHLDGRIDEVRVSARARTAGEVRGYVRTRMPHGTELWDSDPTDAGVVLAASCADAARCVDVVYAGAPLVRDGARYYARGKLRSTTSIWSGWSTWDWFETVSALTIAVPSGTGVTMPVAIAGIDVTATSTITVSTNDRNGYTLTAKGPDDVWGMDGPGAAVLPRWTGAPDAPTPWPEGTSGHFGLTVLSATGGKDTAAWGTGTTSGDFSTLRYVGLQLSTGSVLHRRSTYSALTDTISTSYRVNVATDQQAGSYTTTITYTAIPNV